jgi:hypothetical protein
MTRTPSPETPVSATPSADVSSLIEVVARALCADQSRRHYGIESNWDEQTDYHRNEWLAEARAAIAAHNTEAAIVLKRYREALEGIANWREGSPQPASLNWQRIAKALQANARAALKAGA